MKLNLQSRMATTVADLAPPSMIASSPTIEPGPRIVRIRSSPLGRGDADLEQGPVRADSIRRRRRLPGTALLFRRAIAAWRLPPAARKTGSAGWAVCWRSCAVAAHVAPWDFSL